jgi:hypothetical protein
MVPATENQMLAFALFRRTHSAAVAG